MQASMNSWSFRFITSFGISIFLPDSSWMPYALYEKDRNQTTEILTTQHLTMYVFD